jgi:chloramphenicol 3-O phosphotransferase
MSPTGRVIILNGASSSGKTTLATGLRDRMAARGQLWLLIGIDDHLSMLPPDWLDLGLPSGPGPQAHEGLRLEADEDGTRLVVGDTARRLLRTYHESVAAAARRGWDVIVDDVVVDEATYRDWLEVLGELEPTWVAVRCLPQVAVERERSRGDRPIGMTAAQSDTVHHWVTYAAEVDTSALAPDEALAQVCTQLAW